MAEKKKLAVVVDAGSITGNQGLNSSFDFSGFQESLSSPDNGSGSTSRTLPGGDEGSYTTSYQARKTSIADGLTSEQLVVEHRKSIASVSGADSGSLGGVTLSRRQSMSNDEYQEEINQNAYSQLEPYQFKDSSELKE